MAYNKYRFAEPITAVYYDGKDGKELIETFPDADKWICKVNKREKPNVLYIPVADQDNVLDINGGLTTLSGHLIATKGDFIWQDADGRMHVTDSHTFIKKMRIYPDSTNVPIQICIALCILSVMIGIALQVVFQIIRPL